MKINIFYNFKKGPFGGGNQFLKALKKEFEVDGVYLKDPKMADVILCNSHHNLLEVLKFKKNNPKKLLIHRIDGPINLVRGKGKEIDNIIFKFDKLFCDGIIFQSDWSKKKNMEQYDLNNKIITVIPNGVSQNIFYKKEKSDITGKIKIIITTWSSNWRKGFKYYEYLDKNLDFNKFEVTLIGNSPIEFKNIKILPAMKSEDLANKLRDSDIYLTASESDPCSNSLLEALSCGLPVLALNDGGHSQLIQKGGLLFEDEKDLILKLNLLVKNYSEIIQNIPDVNVKNAVNKYIDFFNKI